MPNEPFQRTWQSIGDSAPVLLPEALWQFGRAAEFVVMQVGTAILWEQRRAIMKKWLTMLVLLLSPLAATGGLAYKIAAGEITDPTFYILLVIWPSAILAGIKELISVAPPSRIGIRVQDGIRGYHWEQASSWDKERSRKGTSLYIPIRLENNDPDKPITLYDVAITDRLTRISLAPPNKLQAKVGGKEIWGFSACNFFDPIIFNAGKTVVPSANTVDAHIMIQENEIHRERYDLLINFKDNYGRKYSLELPIIVQNVANLKRQTTDWPT
jgi:hypothetical protein